MSTERVKYSAAQRRTLEEVFTKQDTIDSTMAQRLANQLSVSVRQIRTWFQNKRAKCKREDFKKSGRSYPIMKSLPPGVNLKISPVNVNADASKPLQTVNHPQEVASGLAIDTNLDSLDLDLDNMLSPSLQVDLACYNEPVSSLDNSLRGATALSCPALYQNNSFVDSYGCAFSLESTNSAPSFNSTGTPSLSSSSSLTSTPRFTTTPSFSCTAHFTGSPNFTSSPSFSCQPDFDIPFQHASPLSILKSSVQGASAISCPVLDFSEDNFRVESYGSAPSIYNSSSQFCSTPNLICSTDYNSHISSSIPSSPDVATTSSTARSSHSSFSSLASLIVDLETTSEDRENVTKIIDYLKN